MKSGASILVLQGGALGDAVLTLAVMNALRKEHPGSRTALASRSAIARWAVARGIIDEAIAIDSLHLHRFYALGSTPSPEVLGRLRRFDHIISFLGGPDEMISRSLTAALGDSVVAIDPRPTAQTAELGRHITAQWSDGLARAGIVCTVPLDGRGVLSDAWRAACVEKLRDKVGGTAGDRLVLLHPGSGGLDKCLPIEAMIELFAAVRALPAAAVWMIGPDEIERFGDSWTKRLHALAPVLYHDDVREAAELACGTDVFVGYDAGMTHLAGLAGLETMAIFGPTDPRVWRPVGPACRVVAFPGEDEPHREWARRIAASLRPSVDGPG